MAEDSEQRVAELEAEIATLKDALAAQQVPGRDADHEKAGEGQRLWTPPEKSHLPCVEGRKAQDNSMCCFMRKRRNKIEICDFRIVAECENCDVNQRAKECGPASRGNQSDSINEDGQQGGKKSVGEGHGDDAWGKQPKQHGV